MHPKKTILHADDHKTIRAALKRILEGHLPEVHVDEACDGNSAFEKVKKNNYDMIILDVTMPNTDSFGLVSNILALKPKSKILMFSINTGEVYVKKYIQSGVMGYIHKDAPIEEIEKAVSTVLNNKKYVNPSLAQLLIDETLGIKPGNPFDALSIREFEITRHLLLEESTSAISKVLNLHPSTISTFKKQIFEKLNCDGLVGLRSLAKIHNILPATLAS